MDISLHALGSDDDGGAGGDDIEDGVDDAGFITGDISDSECAQDNGFGQRVEDGAEASSADARR